MVPRRRGYLVVVLTLLYSLLNAVSVYAASIENNKLLGPFVKIFDGTNPIEFYLKFPYLVDFLLLIFVFFAIAKIVAHKMFGGYEQAKTLVISMSILLAGGFVFYMNQVVKTTLFAWLGKFSVLLVLVLMFLMIYTFWSYGKEGHTTATKIVVICIIVASMELVLMPMAPDLWNSVFSGWIGDAYAVLQSIAILIGAFYLIAALRSGGGRAVSDLQIGQNNGPGPLRQVLGAIPLVKRIPGIKPSNSAPAMGGNTGNVSAAAAGDANNALEEAAQREEQVAGSIQKERQEVHAEHVELQKLDEEIKKGMVTNEQIRNSIDELDRYITSASQRFALQPQQLIGYIQQAQAPLENLKLAEGIFKQLLQQMRESVGKIDWFEKQEYQTYRQGVEQEGNVKHLLEMVAAKLAAERGHAFSDKLKAKMWPKLQEFDQAFGVGKHGKMLMDLRNKCQNYQNDITELENMDREFIGHLALSLDHLKRLAPTGDSAPLVKNALDELRKARKIKNDQINKMNAMHQLITRDEMELRQVERDEQLVERAVGEMRSLIHGFQQELKREAAKPPGAP